MRLDYATRVASLLATAILSPVSIDHDLHDRPRVDLVEPNIVRPGAVVTAFGACLDRSQVLELILTSPDSFALAHIVEQLEELIRLEVPRSLAARRYSIVLALVGRRPPAGAGRSASFYHDLDR